MSNDKFKHQLSNFLPTSILNETDRNIKALKDKINNNEISLILGAGVSQSANLPGWYSMLNMIFGYLFSTVTLGDEKYNRTQIKYINKYINKYGQEKLLQNLERLQRGDYRCEKTKIDISSNIDVLQLAEALYLLIDNNTQPNGGMVHNRLNNYHLIKIIEQIFRRQSTFNSLSDNSTLYQISKLILEKNVSEIITYNYDNYIEETIRKIISSSPSYSHNTDSIISHTYDNYVKYARCINNCNYVNIYHVHGLINLTDSKNDKTTENIILSEDDYYNIESKVYNWVNSVQVKAITSGSALFVGFSATDYNFKRIMKHCSDVHHPHYIIFNLNDYTKKIFPGENFTSSAETLKNKYLMELAILNQLIYSLNTYWKKYNIKPIWCPVDDISKLIEYLYS